MHACLHKFKETFITSLVYNNFNSKKQFTNCPLLLEPNARLDALKFLRNVSSAAVRGNNNEYINNRQSCRYFRSCVRNVNSNKL